MLKFMRKIKWLALICITQSIHTAYSQPVGFDQKFVDSITLRLPAYSDDTSKVNKLVLLARMYLTVEPTTAIKYAKAGDEFPTRSPRLFLKFLLHQFQE